MNKSKSIYHNEIVGVMTIASVLQHGSLSNAKIPLILPFLFHRETLDYLAVRKVRNIKTLTSTNGKLIANFNARYYSLLSVSINSFLIGKQLKLFYEDGNEIKFNLQNLPFNNLGTRISKINEASDAVYGLLSTNAYELYFNLQIKL